MYFISFQNIEVSGLSFLSGNRFHSKISSFNSSKWKKTRENFEKEPSFLPLMISGHLPGELPSYDSKCQVMSVQFHATPMIMSFLQLEVLITIDVSYNFPAFLIKKQKFII